MNRSLYPIAILLIWLSGLPDATAAQDEFEAPPGVTIERDLEFLAADREEKLDLYRPSKNESGELRPAVVIIHGGGWAKGDKSRLREFVTGTTLAKAGYVAISINYETRKSKRWPRNLHDCKNAVRWLRKNSKELGVDGANIGVIGGSAGGHLALMVAYTGDNPKFSPEDLYPGISDSVGCCVDMYGISNLLTRRVTDKKGKPTEELKGNGLLREDRDEAPVKWRTASPVNHIDADSPPTLIFHGTKDKTVDRDQSKELYAVLQNAGVESELQMIEGAGHAWPLKTDDFDLRAKTVAFLKKHLRGKPENDPRQAPNIVFLMTDDQRCDNLGCYGRPEFKTANIDQLARQGVTFDNAYYAVSICMPSRVTMLTGRYISSHQVGFSPPYNRTLSQAEFKDSYPVQLKKAGYRIGFVGKFGFNVTENSVRPNTIKGYDMQEHLQDHFDYFAGDGTHTGGESKIWPKSDETLQAIYKKGRKNTGRTLRTGEAMLHFLDTQPRDVPFCLSVSFLAVKHDSDSHLHRSHYDLFKEHNFSVPENWVEGANENLPKVVVENWRGAPLHLQRSSTPKLYQRQVRRFAAQGYTVDQQVGLLMDKLKEKGMLDNTVVIYTSDNGRFQGSHGLFDKALLYEESMKQPLIVFDGRTPESERGRREDAMISSVDIAPTILSIAGLQPPASMQGHDCSKVLNQTQDDSQWQQSVFMENLFLVSLYRARKKKNADEINQAAIAQNKSYRCRGVRTKRWKYFVYYEHTPQIEELYDLESDPLEQNNLIEDAKFADTLTNLRKLTETKYAAATD